MWAIDADGESEVKHYGGTPRLWAMGAVDSARGRSDGSPTGGCSSVPDVVKTHHAA